MFNFSPFKFADTQLLRCATLPGELCISSQSHVCEGTWPPPAGEIRSLNICKTRKLIVQQKVNWLMYNFA